MVLDGAMGTAIQRDRPDEAGYRGERFADWPSDLQGNNDLLTLTQPDIIAGIHREYLEAGADIIETNTFNANAVSLADYGMEDLAYELNFEAARLARAGRRRGRRHAGPAALRRRRPRPDHPDGLDLARTSTTPAPATSPSTSSSTAYLEAARGLRRRRRRPAPHRDDLRHPQRQGRDLRGRDALRGARPPLAGHHLRHDHRRVRPHAVRPGDRGVLGLGPARPAARRRPQLRARRQGDAPLHRRAVPDRRLASSPATPTPGCPTPSASTTRRPRRPPTFIAEFADAGLRQPRRRLLRHHARAHRARSPRRSTGKPRRDEPPSSQPAMRLSGLEPFTDHRGQPLRQRRRAHQHHRLGEVPQPDQGRRLRHRPQRSPRSRSRTARRSSTSTWTRA